MSCFALHFSLCVFLWIIGMFPHMIMCLGCLGNTECHTSILFDLLHPDPGSSESSAVHAIIEAWDEYSLIASEFLRGSSLYKGITLWRTVVTFWNGFLHCFMETAFAGQVNLSAQVIISYNIQQLDELYESICDPKRKISKTGSNY